MRKSKLPPRGVEMEFEGGLEEEVTAHTGLTLLVETGRRSGVMEKADRVLPPKKNPKGLGQAQMVESFVILSALGGECVEDFQTLRADLGLGANEGNCPGPAVPQCQAQAFAFCHIQPCGTSGAPCPRRLHPAAPLAAGEDRRAGALAAEACHLAR